MNLKEIEKTFESVKKNLQKKSWFKSGKWIVSCHPYIEGKPLGITFHCYKKTWFNEDKRGIHIESYLSLDEKMRKKAYVTIHIFHDPKIPGTNLNRRAVAVPFVDEIFREVSSWDGYKFRAGKYGTQPFTKYLDGNSQEFAEILEAEFTRMCQALGPAMDRVIKQLKF